MNTNWFCHAGKTTGKIFPYSVKSLSFQHLEPPVGVFVAPCRLWPHNEKTEYFKAHALI